MDEPEKSLKTACALNDQEFAERRRWVRAKLLPHVRRVERPGAAVRFMFLEPDAERHNVEEFAALESQCCGFLNFELSAEGEPLSLLVSGPEDAGAVLDAFAAAATT